MNKKIALSLVATSFVIASNSFAMSIEERRAAALEALSGSKKQATEKVEKTEVKTQVAESIEERIAKLEKMQNNQDEYTKLKEKIMKLEEQIAKSDLSAKNERVDLIEKSVIEIEKKLIKNSNNENLNSELSELKEKISAVSENSSSDTLSDLEDDIAKLKENAKYQLYKISSLEDASFDFENRLEKNKSNEIKWHGDFKVGYGVFTGQEDFVKDTKSWFMEAGSKHPGDFAQFATMTPEQINGMLDSMSGLAERKSSFDGEGRLVAYQDLTENFTWLFQLNLTNIAWMSVDKSNREGAIRPYMERGYLETALASSFRIRIGADWVKSTIWSDKHFTGETLNSLAPLYHGEIFPTFNVGAQVHGIVPIGNTLFDYNVMAGNGDANIMETDDSKLFTTRMRLEFPLFDYTRISIAGGYSTETKDDPILNSKYDKLMYSAAVEQKIGDFFWSTNFVGGQYMGTEDIYEDYTKTAVNVTASYTFLGKLTPWFMYDYIDRDKMHGIDLLPMGIPTRDPATGMLHGYLSDLYDVETENRFAIGLNYTWNPYFITKLEQYMSDRTGSSTLMTFGLQF